jgi:hypothetical protein
MKIKRLVAVLTAATMVLGCALTALAAEGVVGTGTYEGDKPTKVTTNCTLPTVNDTTYGFIADPYKLIEVTSGSRYTSATFTNDAGGYVYFNDGTGKYTNSSQAFSVINEGMLDMDISMKVELNSELSDGVSMATADDFDSLSDSASTFKGTDNKIFLGIVTSGAARNTAKAVKADEAVTSTVTVEGIPDNYEIKYVTDKYEYVQKTGATGWKSAGFSLTGAINTNEGVSWSKTGTAIPAIKVTWSCEAHNDTETSYAVFVQNNFWLGTADGVGVPGLTSTSQVTAFTINGKDVLDKATVQNGFLKVTWNDASAKGVTVSNSFDIRATIDGKKYAYTYVVE